MARGESQDEVVFKGIAVSSGVCHGPVVVVGPKRLKIPNYHVSESEVTQEIQRFKQALVETREELQKIQRELSEKVDTKDALIFDAHLLVLEDQTIIDEVTRQVANEKVNVEAAFDRTTQKFATALDAVDDNYLRERAADMRDVAYRVIENLLGDRAGDPLNDLKEPSIIIGHDLSPSTTALFNREMVLGFGTDVGSPTSHTAILARSLQLPAVVGLRDISRRLSIGENLLLDGYDGVVILNPTVQSLYEYGELAKQHEDFENELVSIRDLPGETVDRQRIHLMANIDHPDEVEDVSKFGAEGVGLFRTEYLFLNRSALPNEGQQFEAYRNAATELGERTLLVRTLDLGADKMADVLPDLEESNPALGVRAIRFCLQHEEIFKTQLRAILRASAHGRLKLLFPMISNVEELRTARQILEVCRDELRREQVPFDERLPVGIMIETPAAAMIADVLATEVDFFSIGTNDLIQYGAAVDRLNERVAHLYEPTHPGILRLIKHIVRSVKGTNVSVGVCGEMAGDPLMVPLLIGLGIHHLSASAPLTPMVKHLVRKLELAQVVELADWALSSESGAEVVAACQSLVQRVAPELNV
ncbi:MAG: Phosphoenolpyruvate-protein phosphotransferase [Verrucomicrobia subdivision 3 bacterium]|nr:Phosphoenolpyruvate-protein phosphotransferase [Limisphaerales bacterium]MCS1414553.1 Phosphoenolpyruvate-protein phosphotransferase [Limisphaerales bacterium]